MKNTVKFDIFDKPLGPGECVILLCASCSKEDAAEMVQRMIDHLNQLSLEVVKSFPSGNGTIVTKEMSK